LRKSGYRRAVLRAARTPGDAVAREQMP